MLGYVEGFICKFYGFEFLNNYQMLNFKIISNTLQYFETICYIYCSIYEIEDISIYEH